MAFKETLAEIKQAYDLADYIASTGVSLKPSGAGKHKGLCPFHNERTPSFTIDESFQNYRCFGCGAHGDLIAFVMAHEHLEFMDAVRKLAEDKGIELAFEHDENAPRVDYKALKACLRDTARFFQQQFLQLPDDHAAKIEITKRGLDPKAFRYGYAPEGRQTLYNALKKAGYPDDIILEVGVCNKWQDKIFDFWQGRLMFFMTDTTGNPIGFSGRKLFENDKRGKYVNSSDSPVFDKSSTLFNHDAARVPAGQEGILYVVEGQFDVAAMTEAGMPATVASSGTAFTSKQSSMCARMVGADGKVVFCLDADEAGIQAAVKVFKNSPTLHSMSYAVKFPENMDPADYLHTHGKEALQSYVAEHQVPLVEFVLDALIGEVDYDSEIAKAKAVERGAEVLKTVASEPLRKAYVRMVALRTYSTVETVERAVQDAEPIRNVEQVAEVDHDNILEERYDTEEAPEKSAEEFAALLKSDARYGAAARLILLTLFEPPFRKVLYQIHKLFPSVLQRLAKEVVHVSQQYPDGKIIPERYTDSWALRLITEMGYFPLDDETEHTLESRKQQFMTIREEFRKAFLDHHLTNIRGRYANLLNGDGEMTVAMYQKIAAQEEQEIAKLESSVAKIIPNQ